MTDASSNEERDLLAAEFALGLLDDAALREARVRAASDPDFADAVARWEERLMPFFDEIAPAEPASHVWDAVRRATEVAPAEGANIVALNSRLRRWQAYGAGITAVAASLVLVVGYYAVQEPPSAITAQPDPVLVATLSSEQAETSLAVAYDKRRSSLLVTPGRMTGAPGHDHELWIIPAGSAPISLGLVRAGAPARLRIPVAIAPHFRSRSTIALSVEPVGGSPTGQPTGPVVAAGELVVV